MIPTRIRTNKSSSIARQEDDERLKREVKVMVKSMISSKKELKYFDVVSGTNSTIDWNGSTPTSITDIPQGVSDTNRIGDGVFPVRLRYSVLFKYNQVNTTTNLANSCSLLRMLIVRWKPFFTDVAPTVAKIMTYTGTFYAVQAPLTNDGIDQFTVLADRRVVLDGISQANVELTGTIKLKNPSIDYKAGSTTNQSNGIYVFFISDAQAASGVYPSVATSAFRTQFTDA